MADLTKKIDSSQEYRNLYEVLIDTLAKPYSTNDTEKALSTINFLANFAWHFHPGRFADLRLEQWASKVGQKIWKEQISKIPNKRHVKRRILHVVTETYPVGGHTRLLLNLVKADSESVHLLVITNQQVKDIPDWLSNAIINTGGTINSLFSKSNTEKVSDLQQIMCYQTDKIFYHIHPNDSIPIAALAAMPRPPVMTINHADHVFWLGSALSDIVVCYRVWALEMSMRSRYAQQVRLLPIPLNFDKPKENAKRLARKQIGIEIGEILILTVASAYKFLPSGKYSYFTTIRKIVEANSNVRVKVVGLGEQDDLSKFEFESHDRIELLGILNNPQVYYEAADIYIDSMPIGSYTSLLEAMYFSCFPVLQFSPIDTLNTEQEPATRGIVNHACSEDEQIGIIQQAIDDHAFRERIANEVSNNVKNNYMGAGWYNYLTETYQASAHEISEIRDLSGAVSGDAVITQADIDATNLSRSASGIKSNFSSYWISQNVDFMSTIDVVRVVLNLNKRNDNDAKISLRTLAWLVRSKIKKVGENYWIRKNKALKNK